MSLFARRGSLRGDIRVRRAKGQDRCPLLHFRKNLTGITRVTDHLHQILQIDTKDFHQLR